jgi:hypothetical protein
MGDHQRSQSVVRTLVVSCVNLVILIWIASFTSSVCGTCHYLGAFNKALQTKSLGQEFDGQLQALSEWFASPCEVTDLTMGDFNKNLGFDLFASPGTRFKMDDASWSLDGRFGINMAGGQPAATATTAAAPAATPPLPDPAFAMIMKTMVDSASTQRLESSGTRLEQNLEHHVADLSDRSAAGLKLNRDETGEQIAGLRKQLLEFRHQQQNQQVHFTEKLAPCSSSLSAPFDRAELKKEIVQEVRGDSTVGAPVLSRPFVPSASSIGNIYAKLVPRRLFIKGFCNFGCEADEGISESQAKTVANSLLAHLKFEYRKFLAENNGGILAARFRNSQIT